MTEFSSPHHFEASSSPQPLRLRGEIVLAAAHQEWSQTKQPVLLLDLGQLRQAHQSEVSLATTPLEIVVPPAPSALPQELLSLDIPVQKPVTPSVPQIAPVKQKFAPLSALALPALPTWSWPRFSLSWPHFSGLPADWTLPHLSFPRWTVIVPTISLNWPQLLNLTGNFLLGGALALFLLFSTPILILETQPLISQAIETWSNFTSSGSRPLVATVSPTPSLTPEPHITSAEDVFSVSIPALDIHSVVVPNVDANDPLDYTPALKEGIAHAKGSGLPEQLDTNKTIYLFAHSTDSPWNILRYNAQFYALKDAEVGQEIDLTFWGKKYSYTIAEKRIVEANDTAALQPQTDQEQLILQTCYPPGTVNKRLLVIATPSVNLAGK